VPTWVPATPEAFVQTSRLLCQPQGLSRDGSALLSQPRIGDPAAKGCQRLAIVVDTHTSTVRRAEGSAVQNFSHAAVQLVAHNRDL
jgi:hypothetical protein